MSFNELKKPELQQAAEYFGVDYEERDTKAKLLQHLDDEGVTWDMYKQSELYKDEDADEPVADVDDDEDAPTEQPKSASKNTLLKMSRQNPTYEIRGYRFTRQHPFVPVTEDDANWILENVEGFSIASPREAKEFYS